MPTKIKCEKMTTWDFDHCHECKRFSSRRGKGLNNRKCSLNNDTAQERRDFGEIWACVILQNSGVDITIPEVEIIYVGKRKKMQRKEEHHARPKK
jgi:hypothetical protein